LTGAEFCVATKKAFEITFKYALRFGVLLNVAKLFMTFSILFIVAFSVALAVVLVLFVFKSGPEAGLIIGIVFIVSIFIGASFVTVFDYSCDTVMHCLCVDYELHSGQVKYAPQNIMEEIRKQ
jgi:hypothetical protein